MLTANRFLLAGKPPEKEKRPLLLADCCLQLLLPNSGIFGDPGGIRTHGLSLRRRPLYPAELRDHVPETLCFQGFPGFEASRLFGNYWQFSLAGSLSC